MSPQYDASPELENTLRRWRAPVLIWVALLLAGSLLGGFYHPWGFFRAYLVGFLYCLGLALGSMAFLMLQYLTNGAWGIVTRRTFEAATRTLPTLTVLFIPVALGIPFLYAWATPALVQRSEVLQHRAVYMNTPFVLARAAIYFAVWLTFAYLLNRWSVQQDESPDAYQRRLTRLSAPGLIVYVFTITLAAVDWAQSLHTEWYSTIWGFLFVANQGLTAIAFAILVMFLLSRREPLSHVLRPAHFHALGKLTLMMLLLWAYFSFSQLLIVWAGNLPPEISFYLPRFAPPWNWLGLALVVFQFLIPFLLLLSRPLKRNAALLSAVAVVILFMRYLDLVWIVMPGYPRTGWQTNLMTLTLPAGILGIWLWTFFGELRKVPLLPRNAPELEEALEYETH